MSYKSYIAVFFIIVIAGNLKLHAQLPPFDNCNNPYKLCTEETFNRDEFGANQELWIDYYSSNQGDQLDFSISNANPNCPDDKYQVTRYGPYPAGSAPCGLINPQVFPMTNWPVQSTITFPNGTYPARFIIKIKYFPGTPPCEQDVAGDLLINPKYDPYCPVDNYDCYNAFQFTPANQNLNFYPDLNSAGQIWTTAILSPGATFQYRYTQTSTSCINPTQNPLLTLTVFGPFGPCDDPCELAYEGENQVFQHTFSISGSTVLLDQTDIPLSSTAAQYFFVVSYDDPISTVDCNINLTLNGTGILSSWPINQGNGMNNSNSTQAEAAVICDEFGTVNFGINSTGTGNAWFTFIADPGSSYSFVYNENIDAACDWLSTEFTVTVYGPFSQCDNFLNMNLNNAPIAYNNILNIASQVEDIFFTDLDIDDVAYTSQYYVRITYPGVLCSNCVLPVSYSTYNLHCVWPETDLSNYIAPYSTCELAYHFCTDSDDIDVEYQGNGQVELWFSSFGKAGSMPQIKYMPNGQSDLCFASGTPYQIEVYGPYNSCGNACDLLVNNPLMAHTGSGNLTGNNQTLFQLSNFNPSHTDPQKYFFRVTFLTDVCGPCHIPIQVIAAFNICDWEAPVASELPCEDCLPPIGLIPGDTYIVTGWVKKHGAALDTKTYAEPIGNPQPIAIQIYDATGPTLLEEFIPIGPIIDGWQQITGEFVVPIGGNPEIEIRLKSLVTTYFDDIRMLPKDGSMKCYVYDPINLRFVAELDERHFATFYEYDEEGRLSRIKKETERGVMTIQESKSSTVKNP